ncbi:MAG TPA: alkaline phosphatase D family protein [Nocardioides sp.]|uniref:alkaline phosphatase D family protein n=1 Tax=Nocardioides sp. TaxID=35761 RepID=UPI002B5E6F01|nr:alkaline phosphatase D family protein [Nocardioides sp.]HTW14126.1 alkaline phosphatase D family protein [Nocardioides sp.]
MTSPLRLGPLLRYVDDTSAAVWVETESAATVVVTAGDRAATSRTFTAHGHHYALVEVEGLEPGSHTPYSVSIDGERVWPLAAGEYGESIIATLRPGKPLRMAFGSCRVSVSHDEKGHAAHGVDALRAYALRMAGITGDGDADGWPDLVLFLGDQVYADDTSDEMKAFIEQRRDPTKSPWHELKDYEEYAHLYRLAWSDPANRWLLSTLPSAMIFDDHDIRDDWNTSLSWRREMEATDWWHERVVAGLASYWVYQHLGNLSPSDRAQDALWQRISAYDGPGELDVTEELDRLADDADQRPDSYRWSFARDFDTQARLVVVDSRAARVLQPDQRSILDDAEMAWLDEQLRGDVDHLLIGTSLPFLLAPAIHHAESFSEALASGRFGRLLKPLGEKARQGADLEHWAAFQEGFARVARMVLDVGSGRRGRAPRSVTFLSGDVHHSYVAEAWPDPAEGIDVTSRIVQAVCSPIRNPLPRFMRGATKLAGLGRARPTGRLTRGRMPRSPLRWRMAKGPWYDNNLAVLEVLPGGLRMRWWCGEVQGGDVRRPRLRMVADIDGIG